MTELDALAEQFEAHRVHLRGIAYRMLGSLSEADDAVQEAWLRLTRSDAAEVRDLGAWLTTVVSRLCLDALRARTARREDSVGHHDPDEHPDTTQSSDPEREALAVDQIGRALLVVLDRLSPAERIAFVLHDMFAIPFDEIASVVDRSPATTKKLASRARQRLRGRPLVGAAELRRHRRVVEAFLAASRAGDVSAVIAVLDPDVVRRGDARALPPGRPLEVRGARNVAEEIAVFGRRAEVAAAALVAGRVGIVVAPHGRLQLALLMTVEDDRITQYELVADPNRLARIEIAVLAAEASPTLRAADAAPDE
jgi:RNA polymerase sigma-70 factor (ECF subfamily)